MFKSNYYLSFIINYHELKSFFKIGAKLTNVAIVMPAKNIWHVGGWNRNFGDFAIEAGVQTMLRRVAKRPLIFTPVDCQQTWFHPALIDRLNADADLLLVGGGGMIFHRPMDSSRSGWQFNVAQADLDRIRVPMVVHGIGFNKFYYDTSGFKPEMDDHLRRTQQVAALFSTRNAGTKEELIRRGLDGAGIEVIPDSGMFVPPSPIEIPGAVKGELLIGLNWAGDRVEQRWPGDPEKTARGVAESLARALAAILAARGGGHVVWTPHLMEIDRHCRDVFEAVLGDAFIDVETAMAHIFPPSLYQVPFLADIYRQCGLVIGMRGHANIVPFGAGTRVVAIGSHAKNRFFLDEIGAPDALIDVRDYPDRCREADIRAVLERVLDDADLPRRLAERRHVLQDRADAFNRRALALIDG
jgi:Polysaccharide pyruvyl transferase